MTHGVIAAQNFVGWTNALEVRLTVEVLAAGVAAGDGDAVASSFFFPPDKAYRAAEATTPAAPTARADMKSSPKAVTGAMMERVSSLQTRGLRV